MFHHLPYAEAQQRGVVQQRILDELTEGVSRVEDVDMQRADTLIANALTPISEAF